MASPLTFKCHMLRARNNVHEIPYHVSRTLDCQKQGGSCEETTRHGTVEAVSKNWTQKYANGTADVDKSCAIRNARYRQPGEIIGRVSRNPDNICFPVSSRVYQGVMLLFSLSLSFSRRPTRSFCIPQRQPRIVLSKSDIVPGNVDASIIGPRDQKTCCFLPPIACFL